MDITQGRSHPTFFARYQSQPQVALFLRNLNGGGVERIVLNVACGIAQQGVPVDLVLIKAEGIFLPQVPPSVGIVDLQTKEIDKNRSFKFPTSLQSTTSLPKLIARAGVTDDGHALAGLDLKTHAPQHCFQQVITQMK